jgi:hypothetical protein
LECAPYPIVFDIINSIYLFGLTVVNDIVIAKNVWGRSETNVDA